MYSNFYLSRRHSIYPWWGHSGGAKDAGSGGENRTMGATHLYVGLIYSKRSRYTRVAMMQLQIIPVRLCMHNEIIAKTYMMTTRC
jgi:hypothetical protein